MKIVIPMAGRGTRFAQQVGRNPDYALPKPFILVKGVPLIRWATASFPFLQQYSGDDKPVKFSDLIFICLQEHEEKFYIADRLRRLYSSDINIIFTPTITRGAAETVYLAKEFINSDEEFIESDCDHYSPLGSLWEARARKDPATVGILSVVQPPDVALEWCYVEMRTERFVHDIKEKDPILAASGARGAVGAYYFSHGKDFVKEVEEMIAENDVSGEPGKKEFYISQVYHRFCRKGYLVEVVNLPEAWMLGTPRHVDRFLQYYTGPIPQVSI